jgi:2-dehydro-3-deoxy-D-arabinonate dehydratase
MLLGQIHLDGHLVAAIIENAVDTSQNPSVETGPVRARPIPGHSMLDLIRRSEREGELLTDLASILASRQPVTARLAIPICPTEVYGCGVTYERSASFRDSEQGTADGMYAAVYRAERPEIFFKGTARVCTGPGEHIGQRADSIFTAPEPELALVLGAKGKILGFTLANDVSAWDIERENALYLPQSKAYNACCSLGPVIVSVDSIADPYNLEMTCSITRDGVSRFEGAVSTAKLNRKFEQLIEYLYRSNDIPSGTVVLTGTGIIVTEEAALAPGDVVSIRIPEIGVLENTVRTV